MLGGDHHYLVPPFYIYIDAELFDKSGQNPADNDAMPYPVGRFVIKKGGINGASVISASLIRNQPC